MDRNFIAMTAKMDGTRAIAARLGKKKKLSEMELIALCNFAKIGLLSLFSSLDDRAGEDAGKELHQLIESIHCNFAADGKNDGINRMAVCCTAILSGDGLGKYIFKY